MNGGERELVKALRRTKYFVALPGNDFAWSSRENTVEAQKKLDGLIASIEPGTLPDRMRLKLLFARTETIQEVSSGWGQEFLDLASRFDAAESRVYETFGTRMKSWFGTK